MKAFLQAADKTREQEHQKQAASEPEHDQYGNKIIDMNGPVAPEHTEADIPYSDAPPPDSMYPEPHVPEWVKTERSEPTKSEPEPDPNWEIGD